ncbi:MAG TPA: hypothetical protein VFT82_02775, partial [Candidatus Paceibacterota bacterium]|nr:hypothetical protein [Candidatus Paceibacterota bacterium]
MDKRTTIVWMAILVIVAVVLMSVYKSGVFMPQNQGSQTGAEGDTTATSSAVVPASVNWTPLSPNDEGYAGASYKIGVITSGKYAGRTMYADYISGEMDGYFVDAIHMPDGTRVTFEGCENSSTLQDYVQDCSVTFPDLDAPRKLTDKDGVSLYTYYPFSQAPSLIQGGVSDFIKVSADMKGRPVFLTKDRRTYYLDLPDGRYVRYTPDVSAIIGDDAIPRIEWDSNAPSLNEYSSGDMV